MVPEESDKFALRSLISCLKDYYGPIEWWWPGDADRVIIGSILTQQTRWENVERALDRLDDAGVRTLEDIARTEDEIIMDAIRCTGYYRIKTGRLKRVAMAAAAMGGVESMRTMPPEELRSRLLSINGVGAETADSILCYGFGMNSFVVDAYTVRICSCARIKVKGAALKGIFEEVLPDSPGAYGECHGWFVEYAKEYCIKKRCEECRIKSLKTSENGSFTKGS